MKHRTPGASDNRAIAWWLLSVCVVVFAMVVLGGVTRLTGSGLSMVQWAPILGVLPPLSSQQWQTKFAHYQRFPEYKQKNSRMSLVQFKKIFWVEYAHRILGRSIGVIFFIPLCYFFIRRRVIKSLQPKLIAMLFLGGAQGLLGWYMVKSGLVDNPHVSQYRLTAHLGLAFIIYAFIFWVVLDLLHPRCHFVVCAPKVLARFATVLIILIFTTILSGGFVAGLKAGHVFNTFPLMDGQWIPQGLLAHQPLWRNFLENMITVQFEHRVLATLVFFSMIGFWVLGKKSNLSARSRMGLNLTLFAVLVQLSLGISTLLLHVPIPLAAAHQAGALLLLTAMLFTRHSLR